MICVEITVNKNEKNNLELFLILVWSVFSIHILYFNENILKLLVNIKNNHLILTVIFAIVLGNGLFFFVFNEKYLRGLFSVLGITLFGAFFINNGKMPVQNFKFYINFFIIIIGFLVSCGNFMKILADKKDNYEEIFRFLLVPLVVWRILCERIAFGKLMERNITLLVLLTLGTIIFAFLWMLSENIKHENIKEMIFTVKSNKKQVIYEIIILTIPFYLFKNSWVNTQWIVALTGLYIFIKYNYKNISMGEKIIGFLLLIMGIYLGINYLLNKENNLNFKYYKNIFYAYLFLWVFIQLKIPKLFLRKIIVVGAMSATIPTFSSLLIWVNRGFRFERISSGHPTNWGATAALMLIIFTFFYIFKKEKSFSLIITPLLFSMILTGSRGPIFGYLCGMVLMLLVKIIISTTEERISTIKLGILFTLLIWIMLVNSSSKERFLKINSEASSISRIYLFKESIEQIKAKPLLGNGFSSFNSSIKNPEEKLAASKDELEKSAKIEAFKSNHSHNNILELIRSSGILGFLIYLILHGYLLFIYSYYSLKIKDSLLLLPVFAYVTLEVIGLVDITMIYTRYQMLLYFLYGILFDKIRKYSAEEK